MTARAISLWEPWATAMRLDLKRNETRGWSPPVSCVGDLLLICGAKTRVGFRGFDASLLQRIIAAKSAGWCFGMAAALVRLVAVEQTELYEPAKDGRDDELECRLGNYEPGRFVWMTVPVDLGFEPFPVRGRQQFFPVRLSNELEERVKAGTWRVEECR